MRLGQSSGRVVAAVLVSLLAGAGTPAGAQEPVHGGTLVYGIHAGDPPTYDCHSSGVFSIIHLLTTHYSSLLKIDTAHYPNVVGDVAESWTVSPDAKTYTFRLHPNVKFHDGSPLTSEDVKVTYDRIRNPPPGVTSVRQGLVADIQDIETPDKLTVVFHLKQSNRAMLYAFANPFNCLYSAAKLKSDPDYPAHKVMGSGPFRFVEHVNGSSWKGERFKDYFVPGRPYLDGFEALFLPGPTLVTRMQSGQVLADFRGLAPGERDRVVQSQGDKVSVQEMPWLNTLIVVFNTQKKPFDDPRVRRALSLGIDRWKASQALQQISILHYVGGFLRPGSALAARDEDLVKMPGYSKDIEASRAEAKRLLREAGVPNLHLKLLNRATPTDPFLNAGVFIIDQWRQIGVETEHVQVNDAVWNATMNDGTFDASLDFQGDSIDEPDYQLARYLSVDLSSNRARYTDRDIDALFEKQHAATDDTARYASLRDLETRMMTQAYIVPFLWWDRIVVMSKRVQGWHMTPSHLIGQDLADVWLAP
jgi:peptide/nickel transport system substrate-binding protein